TFGLNARQAGLGDSEAVALYDDLQTRFAALPGVRDVSLSDVPLIGGGTSSTQLIISGVKLPGIQGTSILTVGSGFFTTMQIPIVLGRPIEARDRQGVSVVNEAFVKSKLGDRNPIGMHLSLPRAC